ncbi:MAG: DUF1223 domain-containing protein [Bryobacteraceae bacterium]|jgi:hypothetical protein
MRKQLQCLGWAALALAVPGAPIAAGPANDMTNPRQPVLVELFTSEGCSSCPPADALLEKLDRDQPVPGAQIIVLSEHVDYWNHDGWTDPYSSAAITARQEAYDHRFGLDGPYTPEMVVDGSVEFNGSDLKKAESTIRQAVTEPRIAVRIRAAASGGAGLSLEVDPLPEGKTRKANIYVTYAADSGTSDVLRGENRGRTLHHVSIAGKIQAVGTVNTRAMFKTQLPFPGAGGPAGSRLIAFVQEAGNGRIWGAALYTAPKKGTP